MFIIILQSSVNVGKSTVAFKLRELLHKHNIFSRDVDTGDLRSALRTIPNYLNADEDRILHSLSWQLSYEELKTQAKLIFPSVKDIINRKHSKEKYSIIFHTVPIDAELFNENDFPDDIKFIKIFLDIDEVEHKKRISKQTKDTTEKLKNFINIRKMHQDLKEEAIRNNYWILKSDKHAPKKILKKVLEIKKG